jgi:hypothetical protein
MKAIDRLNRYLEIKGITSHAFEKQCELANGYVGKQLKVKGSIGSNILERIGKEYPDLNLHWLITGQGQVLIKTYGKKQQEDIEQLAQEEKVLYETRDKLIEAIKAQLGALTALHGRKRRSK